MYFFLFASALFIGIVSTILGTLVYFGERQNRINQTFGLVCFFLALWSFGYFFPIVQHSKELSLLSFQLLHIGALFIAPSHFHFVCAFLNIEQKKKKIIIFGYLVNFLFLCLIPTEFFIKDVVPKYNFNYWAEPGLGYHIWLIIWLSYIFGFSYLLFKHFKSSTRSQGKQIKYLLIGSLITFGGGINNFFLFYDINIVPYLTILASAQAIIFAYNIILKKFEQEIKNKELLQKQNAEMRKLLKQQKDFINVTAHELRTPLTISTAYASVMKPSSELKTLQFGLDRLVDRVNEIVYVCENEGRKMQPNFSKVKVKEFFSEIYTNLLPMLKKETRKLIFDDKVEEEIEVEIDRSKIYQLVENLIINAIKFTKENGIITFHLAVDQEKLKFAVTDNGCGVPDDTKERNL